MKKTITRREWLKYSTALALGSMLPLNASAQSGAINQKRKRPNLLFFFPDQMRRHAMGFTGQDPVLTPNIDRFASEGMYFPHATSTFPVCTPWRGMMMTGRFPHETGLVNNCNSTRPDVYLRREERCITDVLHESDYQVGYIGKWHLTAPHRPYLPQGDRGDEIMWDEYTPPADRHNIDYWYGYNAYDDHLRPRYWRTEAKRDDYHYVDQWSPEHEADQIIRYLENTDGGIRDSNKPFALWASMNPPHSPYVKVPERYRQLYKGKTWEDLLRRGNVDFKGMGASAKKAVADYFAAVSGVDDQFGRVLAALKRLNLEEDTIVVFTSDHGDMMGSQNLMGKPHPYEEAFNIPMILRWPGRISAGKYDDLLLGTTDLMPTLLSLLGCGAQIPKQVQGINYSDILLSHDMARPSSALYIDSTNGGHRGVRTHTHTFVLGKGDRSEAPVRLFDNRKDRFQMNNLAHTEPELAAELKSETFRWLKRIGDPWNV